MPVALSFDVQVEIINWVYRGSQHLLVDGRMLSKCSLVCKQWTAPAQRLLFRRIGSWLSQPSLALLLKAVQQNARLGTYTRLFAIVIYTNPGRATHNDNALALLALLPNLDGLSLRAQIDPLSMVSLLEPSLVRVWPDLQSLEIDNEHGEPDLPDLLVPLKTPRRTAITRSTPMAVKWLMEEADTSALRELEVYCINWDEPICLHAFHNTPALENLTSLVLGNALPPQTIINRLVRLEKLVFAVLPTELLSLPSTVHHVGYHRAAPEKNWDVPLRHLLGAMQVLPVLNLVTAMRGLCPADLEDLRCACEEMCVDFVLYDDHRMLRSIRDVHWI
ncbi:hypothetical protein FA95DRAFT_1609514 [Auriscalpium vulgare]|uniref:Uncharacterized protein n=1 Tax=Auriscalpium vulgare TaxID=40419 RepID=A0ACB8RGZ9_9AGAM|nr:hypothetical protein FA95DRAFT_1609514 [Auriscalpium vulgare]